MYEMQIAVLVCVFDGQVITIDRKEPFIIGRELYDSVNGLELNEKTVSRRHALITFEKGEYMICDNGSKNGTFLNGQKLLPHQGLRLHDEDVIVFSKSKYVFKIKRQEQGPKMIEGLFAQFCKAAGRKKLMVMMPEEKSGLFQLQMVKNNGIKGLLPVSHMDTAEGIKLYYEIDGMISWQDMQESKEMSEAENVQVCLQMLSLIKSLPRYLLSENNLVLDRDMIFIDPKYKSPGFIYLPFACNKQGDISEKAADVFKYFIPDKKDVTDGLEMEKYDILDVQEMLLQEAEEEYKDAQITMQKSEHIKEKKSKARQNPLLLICQPFVVFLIAAIYILDLLKPADFIAFVIIALCLDVWVFSTVKKTKGETKEENDKNSRFSTEKKILSSKKEKRHAL